MFHFLQRWTNLKPKYINMVMFNVFLAFRTLGVNHERLIPQPSTGIVFTSLFICALKLVGYVEEREIIQSSVLLIQITKWKELLTYRYHQTENSLALLKKGKAVFHKKYICFHLLILLMKFLRLFP